jgi:hypothetical protein
MGIALVSSVPQLRAKSELLRIALVLGFMLSQLRAKSMLFPKCFSQHEHELQLRSKLTPHQSLPPLSPLADHQVLVLHRIGELRSTAPSQVSASSHIQALSSVVTRTISNSILSLRFSEACPHCRLWLIIKFSFGIASASSGPQRRAKSLLIFPQLPARTGTIRPKLQAKTQF